MSSSAYTVAGSTGYLSESYGGQAGTTSLASYGNIFSDATSAYMPKSVKSLFNLCEHFATTDPLIYAATTKMASYPITGFLYQGENEQINDIYEYIFDEVLHFRPFLVEVNLDYKCFGNAFASVHHPLRKVLICPMCKHEALASTTKFSWISFQFAYRCPACGASVETRGEDRYVPSTAGLRLIRWNPRDINIDHNPVTGADLYFYTIPPLLANAIAIGRKDIVTSVPRPFLDAVASGSLLQFKEGSLFHMKRTSISSTDSTWGTPLIAPVLKLAFYQRILQKSQEAVALEHIIPFRILFPQSTPSLGNAYTSINLTEWRDDMSDQVKEWRRDHNYFAMMPYPVGYQTIGGQGRALMLHQEMRLVADMILAGMGCPSEFVFGGLSFSGASVSLRTLENVFIGMRADMMRLIRFVIRDVSRFLRIPKIPIGLKPFKMADDLQRAAFDFQLTQNHLISKRSFLQGRDYDWQAEQGKIEDELDIEREVQKRVAIQSAEINGEAGLVSARYQAQQQKLMQTLMPPPPAAPPPTGVVGEPTQAYPPGVPLPESPPPAMSQGQLPQDSFFEEVPPEEQGYPAQMLPGGYPPGVIPQDMQPPAPPTVPGFGAPYEGQVVEIVRPRASGDIGQMASSIAALPIIEQQKALYRLSKDRPDVYQDVLTEVNLTKVRNASGFLRQIISVK